MRRRHTVSLRLTLRELNALHSYCASYGVSISECLRAAVLPEIPPEHWQSQEPEVPGQLRLVEEAVTE